MPRKLDHVTNCLFLPVQGCQIKSPFLPSLLRAEDVEKYRMASDLRGSSQAFSFMNSTLNQIISGYASEDHEYFFNAPNCEITPFSPAPLRMIS
ncbi:hypothetical protein V6N12_076350 [Hibiscus sabdariffa]|uniref:Uncharacterized protein n=1 Tax=Hibiscus sabdariffa TaxID=183260 RepID=A0ABR2DAE5_9ROSI